MTTRARTCVICGTEISGPAATCTRDCAIQLRALNKRRDSPSRGGHSTHHHRIYGLSCEQFDALLARSGGRCEVCDVDPGVVGPVDRRNGLLIDHDHVTGKVRGLVCAGCNAFLKYVDAGRKPPSLEVLRYLSVSRAAA